MALRRLERHAYQSLREKQWENAISFSTAALRKCPDMPESFFIRGYARDKMGNNAESAISDFTEALRLKPDHHDAALRRGILLMKNGDEHIDQAIADFCKVIELLPNDHEALLHRGTCCLKRQQVDRAILDFTEVIRLQGPVPEAHFGRASARMRKRDIDAAIEDFSRAIKMRPSEKRFTTNRASAYLEKHDFEKAVADYSRVLQDSKEGAEVWRARGYCLLMANKPELARSDLDQAIRLQPMDPETWNSRALWHLAMENYREAKEDLRRAIELSHEEASYLGNYGRTLLCLGDPKGALDHVDKAVGLESDKEDRLYHVMERACIAAHLKQFEGCFADLKMLDAELWWEFIALAISFQAQCLKRDESAAQRDWGRITYETRKAKLVLSVDDILSHSVRLRDQLKALQSEVVGGRQDIAPYLIVLKFLWNEDPFQSVLLKSVQWFVRLFASQKGPSRDDLRIGLLSELLDRFVARRSLTIECPYVGLCHKFLEEGLQIPKHWFDHTGSKCYCANCLRGQTIPDSLSEPKGASDGLSRRCSYPSGWVKFGLPVSPNDKGGAKDVFKEWCLAYHRTSSRSAKAIMRCGAILHAGETTPSGERLQVAPGHIDYKKLEDGPLKEEVKSFVHSRFVTSSINYAACYGKRTKFRGKCYRIVFEARIQPDAFKDSLPVTKKGGPVLFAPGQQHTLPGSVVFADPLFPIDCLEWFTDREAVIVLTGLFVSTCDALQPSLRSTGTADMKHLAQRPDEAVTLIDPLVRLVQARRTASAEGVSLAPPAQEVDRAFVVLDRALDRNDDDAEKDGELVLHQRVDGADLSD